MAYTSHHLNNFLRDIDAIADAPDESSGDPISVRCLKHVDYILSHLDDTHDTRGVSIVPEISLCLDGCLAVSFRKVAHLEYHIYDDNDLDVDAEPWVHLYIFKDETLTSCDMYEDLDDDTIIKYLNDILKNEKIL